MGNNRITTQPSSGDAQAAWPLGPQGRPHPLDRTTPEFNINPGGGSLLSVVPELLKSNPGLVIAASPDDSSALESIEVLAPTIADGGVRRLIVLENPSSPLGGLAATDLRNAYENAGIELVFLNQRPGSGTPAEPVGSTDIDPADTGRIAILDLRQNGADEADPAALPDNLPRLIFDDPANSAAVGGTDVTLVSGDGQPLVYRIS